MKTAIIFGGAGYIGHATWQRLLSRFERIILADICAPKHPLPDGVVFQHCDVRKPIDLSEALDHASLIPNPESRIPDPASRIPNPASPKIDWIFHYSAIHREPGHPFEEYFDTNLPGAEHVTAFADAWQVPNIFFTSSIAVYGPTRGPTSETTTKYPDSGYGISKLSAELIHERWAAGQPERRLIICRPGVVYGPHDPGNILRMIRAVRKGRFFFPGKPTIHKSYAYIEGLLDSIEFTMARCEKVIHYNYVESPTEPLEDLVRHIEQVIGRRSRTIVLPLWLLVPVAHIIQKLSGGRSPIHPKRVHKAAMPTYIIPQWLIDHDFEFKHDFKSSLEAWQKECPEEFE